MQQVTFNTWLEKDYQGYLQGNEIKWQRAHLQNKKNKKYTVTDTK